MANLMIDAWEKEAAREQQLRLQRKFGMGSDDDRDYILGEVNPGKIKDAIIQWSPSIGY